MEQDNLKPQKIRHGCVSAWLLFMIIGGSLAVLTSFYFTKSYEVYENLEMQVDDELLKYGYIFSAINVICAFLMWKWKKIGFWICVGSICANIALDIVAGIDWTMALSKALGILVIYGILQFKGDGVSAWKNLE